MTVGRAFLDPDQDRVHAVHELRAMAYVASRMIDDAFALTVRALLLELLHEARCDLLLCDDVSLALAVRARVHVVGVVGT